VLVVLAGRVEVSTRDERAELGAGQGVEWQEGEWHETRSLEPSTLLLVEGDFE
jgi:mannose-6-phosphate isomerase-like protein (cupin superfamily)